jgi:hypothetical protein
MRSESALSRRRAGSATAPSSSDTGGQPRWGYPRRCSSWPKMQPSTRVSSRRWGPADVRSRATAFITTMPRASWGTRRSAPTSRPPSARSSVGGAGVEAVGRGQTSYDAGWIIWIQQRVRADDAARATLRDARGLRGSRSAHAVSDVGIRDGSGAALRGWTVGAPSAGQLHPVPATGVFGNGFSVPTSENSDQEQARPQADETWGAHHSFSNQIASRMKLV